ncbi:MAG: hypothetical protein RDV48_07070 [Candidatus Eremiobacteraeota bacterium]|nr:hypothetical protein [Candidatus Eremiobacteraeota bacterium]
MSGQEVRTMLETNLQRFEEEAMMKGRQEGRLEGKQEERSKVAARLKSLGLNRETIKKATALSDTELDSIERE